MCTFIFDIVVADKIPYVSKFVLKSPLGDSIMQNIRQYVLEISRKQFIMITSSSGSGTGATVSGSRIPVAKHRQSSPEHFTNHNNFPHSQQHNVSKPKYQINANNQHDSAVSSSGGSTGGSGESEGESSGVNCKRRKDKKIRSIHV